MCHHQLLALVGIEFINLIFLVVKMRVWQDLSAIPDGIGIIRHYIVCFCVHRRKQIRFSVNTLFGNNLYKMNISLLIPLALKSFQA
ncbi:MAG: hypothetical protein ACI8Z9_002458 [Paraglaciecola sp.]|jgi:hypothetical protein